MPYNKPQYRFFVTAPDLNWWLGFGYATMGRALGELTPENATMSWGLNKPGTLSLEVQKRELDFFHSAVADPAWKGNIQPSAATIWVIRDAEPVWAGFIWDLSSTSTSNTVTLNCEDFTGYYSRLTLSNSFSLAQNTVGQILKQLLQIEGNLSSQMVLWGVQRNDLTSSYTTGPGENYLLDLISPQWYEYENRKISDLISYLQTIGTGFEWTQNIRPSPAVGAFTFRAFFEIGKPQLGANFAGGGGYAYKPIEWGAGTLETAEEVSYTYSARQTATQVKVQGFGDRSASIRRTLTSATVPGMPLMRLVHSEPELGRDGGQTVVDAKAAQILQWVGAPQLQVTAKIRPSDAWAKGGVLYEQGDTIGSRYRVRIKDAGMDYVAKLRANAWAIQLNPSGDERIVIDLGPDTSSFT